MEIVCCTIGRNQISWSTKYQLISPLVSCRRVTMTINGLVVGIRCAWTCACCWDL